MKSVRFFSILLIVAACGKTTVAPPAPDASAPIAVVEASAEAEPDDPPTPPPPGPLAKTCDGVALVLLKVTQREQQLQAHLELRSSAKEHVSLMVPGDGSSSGARNPTLAFTLTPNQVGDELGCGNLNGLSPNDFVYLAPKGRKPLDWIFPPAPSKAGRYTLSVTYRNDPNSTMLGGNRPGPRTDRLRERVRTTVPCTLKSNTVSFFYTR